MRRPDPARPYIRAFFERNRLRFLGTAALYLLEIPSMLIVSRVLGDVVDAIAVSDAAGLLRLLWAAAGVAVFLGAAETLYYRALGGWTERALCRYKSYAFRKGHQRLFQGEHRAVSVRAHRRCVCDRLRLSAKPL